MSATPPPRPIERFVVFKHIATPARPYHEVRDTEAHRWNMPGKAVSVYFASEPAAQAVADILNAEWMLFLSDPW